MLFGAFAVGCAFAFGYGMGYDAGKAWRRENPRFRKPVLAPSPDGVPIVQWEDPV